MASQTATRRGCSFRGATAQQCLSPLSSKTYRSLSSNRSCQTETPVLDVEDLATYIFSHLDTWLAKVNCPQPVQSFPIGSSIILPAPDADAANNMPYLVPNYGIEKEYLTLDDLGRLWNKRGSDLPSLIEFDSLSSFRRLDHSVSLVKNPGDTSELAIFKTLANNIYRMYHEFRVLLQIPPHPNILSKPQWLVIRKIHASAERVVCGFVVEYHPGGSLERRIHEASQHDLSIREKLRWSGMIVSALLHNYNFC